MTDATGATRRAVDWLLRDRSTGRYVVVQWPNPPLWAFLVARTVEWLTGATGIAGPVVHWLGTAALVWWAVDEVLRGVNPVRRVGGACVLVLVAVGLVPSVASAAIG